MKSIVVAAALVCAFGAVQAQTSNGIANLYISTRADSRAGERLGDQVVATMKENSRVRLVKSAADSHIMITILTRSAGDDRLAYSVTRVDGVNGVLWGHSLAFCDTTNMDACVREIAKDIEFSRSEQLRRQ